MENDAERDKLQMQHDAFVNIYQCTLIVTTQQHSKEFLIPKRNI